MQAAKIAEEAGAKNVTEEIIEAVRQGDRETAAELANVVFDTDAEIDEAMWKAHLGQHGPIEQLRLEAERQANGGKPVQRRPGSAPTGTETTAHRWDPPTGRYESGENKGRPIPNWRPPTTPKPTGRVMSQSEIEQRRKADEEYRRKDSAMRAREQARRGLDAYLSHEADGGTLSDEHEQRKREYMRILGEQ